MLEHRSPKCTGTQVYIDFILNVAAETCVAEGDVDVGWVSVCGFAILTCSWCTLPLPNNSKDRLQQPHDSEWDSAGYEDGWRNLFIHFNPYSAFCLQKQEAVSCKLQGHWLNLLLKLVLRRGLHKSKQGDFIFLIFGSNRTWLQRDLNSLWCRALQPRMTGRRTWRRLSRAASLCCFTHINYSLIIVGHARIHNSRLLHLKISPISRVEVIRQ